MRMYGVVPLASLSMPICPALLMFLVAQACGAPADSTLDGNSTLLNQSQTTLDQLASASALISQTQTSQDEPVPDTALISQTQTSQDEPVPDTALISQTQTSQDESVPDTALISQTRTSQDEPVLRSSLISQVQTSQDESVLHSSLISQVQTSQDESAPISQPQTSEDEPVLDSTLVTETETLREHHMSESPTSPEASDLLTPVTNTVSLLASLSESPSDGVTVAPPATSQSESLTFQTDSVIKTDQLQTKTEVIDATPTLSDSSSSSLSLNDYILRLFDPNASYRKCTDVSSWYDAWRKARQGPTQHPEIHSSSLGFSSESMSITGFVSETPTETYTEIEQSTSFLFRSEYNDLSDLDPTETGEFMSYTTDASLSYSQGSVISEPIVPGSTASETMTSYSTAVDSLNVSSVNYTSSTVPDSVSSRLSETLESTLMTNYVECTDCMSPSSVAITGGTTNIINTFHGSQQTTPLDLSLVVSTTTVSAEPDLQSSTSEVPTMIVYYNFSGSIVFCETTVPPKVFVSSSSEFLETAFSDSTASLSSVTSDDTGNGAGGEGAVTDDTTSGSGSSTGGNTAAPGGSTGSTSPGPGSGSEGGSGTTGGQAIGLTNPGGTGSGTSPGVQVLSTTPQPTTRKKSNNMSRSVVIGLVCGVAFCVGFLVTCMCFYKFCCNGPSISPQLYNYKPHDPHFVPSPSPATSHRAKRIFVAD